MPEGDYVRVTIDRALFFPSSTSMRNAVNEFGLSEAEATLPVVIDLAAVHTVDYTTAKALKDLHKEFKGRGQRIVLVNVAPGLERMLEGLEVATSGALDTVVDRAENI